MRVRAILRPLRAVDRTLRLPAGARAERRRERMKHLAPDPPIEAAIEKAVGWLCRAQDLSTSRDGGVARHFSLIDGWASSYPETTGYIVPTFLEYARQRGDDAIRQRAKRMLDWLVSIQFQDGSFQGGRIDATPEVSVVFNTGQILLGLASGVREFGTEYREAMLGAADWLVQTQDQDGCWRRGESPFALPGAKAYATHVAWGLFEAARLAPERPYAAAARANIQWTLGLQQENGWFGDCCLTDPRQPLTHTIGYTLLGIVEAYRFGGDAALLEAACRTADGLLGALRTDGFLPGRLDHRWRGTVRWACLTGSAQIARCWLWLYQCTGEWRYWNAARSVTRYLRRSVDMDGGADTRGALKGSYPISGGYCSYEYPNWAAKFFIDASMLESAMMRKDIPCQSL